jgi:hypothetical protein
MYFISYENKLVQIFKDRLSQVRIIYMLCKNLKTYMPLKDIRNLTFNLSNLRLYGRNAGSGTF